MLFIAMLMSPVCSKILISSTTIQYCWEFPGPWCEKGKPIQYEFEHCEKSKKFKCMKEVSEKAIERLENLDDLKEIFHDTSIKRKVNIEADEDLQITATRWVDPKKKLIPNVYVTTLSNLKIVRHGSFYGKTTLQIQEFWKKHIGEGVYEPKNIFSWVTFGSNVTKERPREKQQNRAWKEMSYKHKPPFRLILNPAGIINENVGNRKIMKNLEKKFGSKLFSKKLKKKSKKMVFVGENNLEATKELLHWSPSSQTFLNTTALNALGLAAMIVEHSAAKGDTMLFINCKSGLDRTGIAYALVVGYSLAKDELDCKDWEVRKTMVEHFAKLKDEKAKRCKEKFTRLFYEIMLNINQPIAFMSTGYRGLKSNKRIATYFMEQEYDKAFKQKISDQSKNRGS